MAAVMFGNAESAARILSHVLPDDTSLINDEEVRHAYGRVLRPNLEIGDRHLPTVEEDGIGELVICNIVPDFGLIVRRIHNTENLNLFAVLRLYLFKRLRQCLAMRAIGPHDVDKNDFAAIVLNVVLLEGENIHQRKSRRPAAGRNLRARREGEGNQESEGELHIFPYPSM